MKFRVSFNAECQWIGEVEMTQLEYDEWNARLDDKEQNKDATLELFERCKLKLNDPTDSSDPELDDFYPKVVKKTATR